MKYFKILIVISLFQVFYPIGQANAQLYGTGWDTVRYTAYVVNQIYDKIYIYNASEKDNNLETRRGTLKAVTPDSITGAAFIWSKYDYLNKKYVQFDSVTVADGISSTIDTLESGGYQVQIIRNTVIDTVFRAWIFINKLRLHLQKTCDGKLSNWKYSCDHLDLGVIRKNESQCKSYLCDSLCDLGYIHAKFLYANPLTGKTITLKNDTTIVWSANPPLETAFNSSLQVYVYDKPWENTTFTINFEDEYHNSATDNVVYESVNPKSKFDLQISDNYKVYGKNDSTGEAPLMAVFTNNSLNAQKYEWILADTFINATSYYNRKDTAHLIRYDTSSVHYTYYRPWGYKVRLISYGPGDLPCTDTLKKDINVYYPLRDSSKNKLSFPNAFSPNNDGSNDIFIYKKDSFYTAWKSIRNLHLKMFNVWGKLVFEHNGPVLEGGKDGWDGRTRSGAEAPPGIYFYYYKVTGWGPFVDEEPFKEESDGAANTNYTEDKLKKGPFEFDGSGFVYLFRK